MRTRSQAVSPNGFQSLTTPPRRRKPPAASRASEGERPQPESKKGGKRPSRKPRKITSMKEKKESTHDEQHTVGAVGPAIHTQPAEPTAPEPLFVSSIESEPQIPSHISSHITSHILPPSIPADSSTPTSAVPQLLLQDPVSAPGSPFSSQLRVIPEISLSASPVVQLNPRLLPSTSSFRVTAAAVQPGPGHSVSALSDLPSTAGVARTLSCSPIDFHLASRDPPLTGDQNRSLSGASFRLAAPGLIPYSSGLVQSSSAPGLTQVHCPSSLFTPATPVFAQGPSQSSSLAIAPRRTPDLCHSSEVTPSPPPRLARVHSHPSSKQSQSATASDLTQVTSL